MVPDLAIVIILYSQTVVGILGNWSLLFYYFTSVFRKKSLMPKDEILKHVAFANFLIMITRGIHQTIVKLELKYFLNDTVCKFVVYLYRVPRGTSLHCSSLLSCFQAIIINPSNSRWMKFKYRAAKYIFPSCFLSWLAHLLLNSRIIMSMTGLCNNKNFTRKFNVGSCLAFFSGRNAAPLYIFLINFVDVFYLCTMTWSSVSMMNFLYSHKNHVQYIHSVQQSVRISAEARATQFILILVGTYVTSYSVSFTIILYLVLADSPQMWLGNTLILLENCFPSFFPFMVIHKNINSIFSIILPCCKHKQFP